MRFELDAGWALRAEAVVRRARDQHSERVNQIQMAPPRVRGRDPHRRGHARRAGAISSPRPAIGPSNGGSASELGALADVDLLALVAAGSADAVGALYDRHAAFLLRLSRGLLGDRTAAERVVRDTLLSVWRRPPGDLQRICVRTWLSSVAVRLATKPSGEVHPSGAPTTTLLPAGLSPVERCVLVLAAMGLDQQRLVDVLDLSRPQIHAFLRSGLAQVAEAGREPSGA